MASRSEFDQLVRAEINKAGARGGEQDARDRVARRLNAQEGGNRNSSAYRPTADKTAASRGSGGGTARGGGGRSGGKGVPTPSQKPTGGLPDTTSVVPSDKPDQTAQDGSMRGYIIPMLMAAALGGEGARRMFRGNAGGPNADVRAPKYPWDSGGSAVPATPVKPGPVLGETRAPALPIANASPDTPLLPAPKEQLLLPPPAPTGTMDDRVGRFLQESEIQDMVKQNLLRQRMADTAPSGDVGARMGNRVYRPGIDVPAPSPGMYGSKFGQPKLIVRPQGIN